MATLKSLQWCEPCYITVDKEITYLRQWIFASAYSKKKKKKEEKIPNLMKLALIQKVISPNEQLNIHSIKALHTGIGNDSKLS